MFSSFVLSKGFAAVSTCIEKYEIFDNNTQVQVLESGNNCYVSVHPRNAFEDLIYRDYTFDAKGVFMIFDSYGEGAESQTTAAREFIFFPRTTASLGYQYDADSQRLSVTTVSGKVFVFDTIKTVLVEVSGTTVQQNYTIKPENRGGLEILKNDGVYMDGGFKRGQSPSQSSKGEIQFKDPVGGSCDLRNADIYNYNTQEEAEFKFDDKGLAKFLSSRCPKLRY